MITVTLLTQADCGYCDHAKHVLDQLGHEFDLHVTEIDMATEPGHSTALAAGVLFPPGVLLDGAPISYGRVSERVLRRLMSRLSNPTP